MDGSVNIPDGFPIVMDLKETSKYEEWKPSRLWARQMMTDIPGLADNFVLDQITLGDGQCFYTATLQQLRRPEISENLSPRMQKMTRAFCPRAFKTLIRKFIINNKHPAVLRIQEDFESFTGKTWEEYWSVKHMMKKETWAEEPSIRATAWFVKMDIVIHQNIPGSPKRVISGNIDEDVPLDGPQLHLGYILSKHYQSLLPKVNVNADQPEPFNDAGLLRRAESLKLQDLNLSLEMESAEQDLNYTEKRDDICQNIPETDKCPVCGKMGKVILEHINKSKHCRENVTMLQRQELLRLADLKKKMKKDEQRKRNFENDPDKVREDNKRWKVNQRMNMDPEELRQKERILKANQRMNMDTEILKEINRRHQQNHRLVQAEEDRLKLFLENTLFGPSYTVDASLNYEPL